MGPFSTRSFALFLGITLATAAPAPATSDAQVVSGAPAEANARLADFGYAGSGCPQGSATSGFDAAVNCNRFYFPDLTASIAPGDSQSDHSNNCLMQISLDCDPGWKFTVKPHNTKLTAHVNLRDGVAASYITTYDIIGTGQARGVVQYSFTGPRNDNPSVADPAPSTSYPTSKCGGGILVVDRRVSLSKGTSSSPVGSMQLWGDANDGDGTNANFVPWGAIEWSRC
ncbi:uncharacterized protein BP5553_10664 [Venustampulla echinocandica]|uniref:Secreted protein n=1 Tax=Venustampulla echinocandica TaxID=2656787 RepID=A0A370T8Q7_9HELO|nr:uncharacterized protein BP5553_10664 [Venustampulla echinocandica]RDL29799.1 hypothetical protein BP5553_10664 [Venustampulla echinocandica]